MKNSSVSKHKTSRVDKTSVLATLRIYWSYFVKDKRHTYPGIALTTTAHLLRYVISPLMIALIIQAVVTNNAEQGYAYVIGLGLTLLGSTIANQIGQSYMMYHEERVQTELIKLCSERLMQQSYSFFTDRKVGALTNDINGFTRGYLLLLDQYMYHTSHLLIGIVVGLVVVMFVAPLLLFPLSLAAFLLIATNIHNVRARSVYRNERKRLQSGFVGELSDVVGNQILARIFARETYEVRNLLTKRKAIHELANKEISVILRETAYRSSIIFGIQTAVFGVIVWLVATDHLAIAGAVFSAQYMLRVSESMFQVSSIIRGYEQIFLDAANMTEILGYDLSVVDAPNATHIGVTEGKIVFEAVDFSYIDKGVEAVFNNLSLSIPSGQRVGLAGHSGGGKTTLTKLLLRFMDIDAGKIAIDGQDIATVTQESLRSEISYVPQDPFLFHRSLRENIGYGKPDASDSDIIEAAKKAHAWEFIKKLPGGLDTVVGERGVKLSGGQRQRVAIARAILKDAPILILDEATSSLDSESEKLIQKALESLMKNRTSIVIAHRLSTIAKLDRIVVLDEGEIVEDGPHEDLLSANGTYARLWKHQSGDFIEE